MPFGHHTGVVLLATLTLVASFFHFKKELVAPVLAIAWVSGVTLLVDVSETEIWR